MLKRAKVSTLGNGRVVYVHGTHYEQGRQLGAAAADLTAENVRAASVLMPDVDLAAYAAMTRRNEAWVERVYPEFLEELHGLAEGSGVAYEELLHLNLNTDVAYAKASSADSGRGGWWWTWRAATRRGTFRIFSRCCAMRARLRRRWTSSVSSRVWPV